MDEKKYIFVQDNEELIQPTEEQQEAYRREMGTTMEKIKAEVAQIKSWLATHPVLPAVEDEIFLERFHSHCKYKIEKTKKKLDVYYRMRALEPEFLLNRNPLDPAIQKALEGWGAVTLPVVTPEGYRIYLHRLYSVDPQVLQPETTLKCLLMWLDSHIRDDLAINFVIIIDMKGATMQHILKFTPNYFNKLDRCSTKAFPHRYANVHLLNVKPFMNTTINIFKMFLGKKVASRVIVHDDYCSLYEYIPKDILPKEYGGTFHMNLDQLKGYTLNKLVQKKSWFEKERHLVADLHQESEQLSYEIYGTKGTFTKIEVD